MTARITGHTERGREYFVAHCHELPITTSGDTIEEHGNLMQPWRSARLTPLTRRVR